MTMKNQRIRPKDLLYPLIAWSLFLLLTSLYFIFVCPWYYQEICKPLPILHGLFVFYVAQNFFQSMLMDPGVYHSCPFNQRHDEGQLKNETQSYVIQQVPFDVMICTSCLIVKPPRTHHCRNCGFCVDNMDHHCPWLYNCVGRRNYRFFLRFLFTLLIHLNLTFICSLYLIVASRSNLNQSRVYIACLLVICIALLVGPVGGLFGLHMILVSKNITTFEQVTGKLIHLKRSPFDRGMIKNWLHICCTSIVPQLNRYSTKDPCFPTI